MALTIAPSPGCPSPTAVVRSGVLGGLHLRLVRITTDASYVNGTGYTVPLTGANSVLLDTRICNIIGGEGLSGFKPVWDATNNKLRFMKGAAGVDAEAATNEATLSGAVFDVMVLGF
jgi:hypothetical protein